MKRMNKVTNPKNISTGGVSVLSSGDGESLNLKYQWNLSTGDTVELEYRSLHRVSDAPSVDGETVDYFVEWKINDNGLKVWMLCRLDGDIAYPRYDCESFGVSSDGRGNPYITYVGDDIDGGAIKLEFNYPDRNVVLQNFNANQLYDASAGVGIGTGSFKRAIYMTTTDLSGNLPLVIDPTNVYVANGFLTVSGQTYYRWDKKSNTEEGDVVSGVSILTAGDVFPNEFGVLPEGLMEWDTSGNGALYVDSDDNNHVIVGSNYGQKQYGTKRYAIISYGIASLNGTGGYDVPLSIKSNDGSIIEPLRASVDKGGNYDRFLFVGSDDGADDFYFCSAGGMYAKPTNTGAWDSLAFSLFEKYHPSYRGIKLWTMDIPGNIARIKDGKDCIVEVLKSFAGISLDVHDIINDYTETIKDKFPSCISPANVPAVFVNSHGNTNLCYIKTYLGNLSDSSATQPMTVRFPVIPDNTTLEKVTEFKEFAAYPCNPSKTTLYITTTIDGYQVRCKVFYIDTSTGLIGTAEKTVIMNVVGNATIVPSVVGTRVPFLMVFSFESSV